MTITWNDIEQHINFPSVKTDFLVYDLTDAIQKKIINPWENFTDEEVFQIEVVPVIWTPEWLC